MPDISVIIPAYNRAGLIGATLRSLLNQTLPAKEIILVDDGSTDGTAEKALEAFENWKLETGNLKNDGRNQFSENSKYNIQNTTLKILRQQNSGPGAARNRGLAEATGEFIHFFDSDDIAAPNKHEVQLRALLETGADITYGPWVKGRFLPSEKLKRGNPEKLKALDTRHWSLDAGSWNFVPKGPVLQARGLPKGNLVQALLTNWSVVPHACLFRKSIVEKAGAFPEDLFGTEDQSMFLRCLLAGAKVVHTPGTFELYRVGDSGKITATGYAQKRHAREWAMFLLKANKEVTSGEWRVTSAGKRVPAEAQRHGDFLTTDYTDKHGNQKNQNGNAQGTCAGASEPDSLTSKLADSPVSESPTRSASGPAEALSADNAGIGSVGGNQLADSKEVLEGQTQAGLQIDNQKLPTIRVANDPALLGNILHPCQSVKSVVPILSPSTLNARPSTHPLRQRSGMAFACGRMRLGGIWRSFFRTGRAN